MVFKRVEDAVGFGLAAEIDALAAADRKAGRNAAPAHFEVAKEEDLVLANRTANASSADLLAERAVGKRLVPGERVGIVAHEIFGTAQVVRGPVQRVGSRLGDRVEAAAGETTLPDVVGRDEQLQLLNGVDADRLRLGLAGRRAGGGQAEQVVVDRAVNLDAVVSVVTAGYREGAGLGVDRDRREVRRCAREVFEAARHCREVLQLFGGDVRGRSGARRIDDGIDDAFDCDGFGDVRQRQLEIQLDRLAERHGDVRLLLRSKAGQRRGDRVWTSDANTGNEESSVGVRDR